MPNTAKIGTLFQFQLNCLKRKTYFSSEENLVETEIVFKVLMQKMGIQKYKPNDWRLFIDPSKRSLKYALLHNENEYGSIFVGHSTSMKGE